MAIDPPNVTLLLPIGGEGDDAGDVGEARRAVRTALAARCDPDTVERAALIVTELARNIARHTDGGELLVTLASLGDAAWIDVLALDAGPGMEDVARCMRDGYSTGGSPGTGLGAVHRLSDEFAIESAPGGGTVVAVRVWPGRKPASADWAFDFAALSAPVSGEQWSGDAWAARIDDGRLSVILADGLGHGVEAAAASSTAVRGFCRLDRVEVDQLHRLHVDLSATRGAAVAIAAWSSRAAAVQFAGVGNIAACTVDRELKQHHLVGSYGTLGLAMPTLRVDQQPLSPDRMLVMTSDGINTRWSPADFNGLSHRSPLIVAGLLYRRCQRRSDDVSVVAVRPKDPNRVRDRLKEPASP